MTKIHTEIVVNDIHIPKHNKKAVKIFLDVVKDLKPNGITLNGDIMDCGTFSRHDRFASPKCHWTDSQYFEDSEKDYQEMATFLDELKSRSPRSRIRYEYGNHEVWVSDFIKESPKTRHKVFSLEERLQLKKRKIEIYKYGDFMRLGKLRVTHGLYTGEQHAKKHLQVMGKSILYGHVHDIQVYSKVTPESVSHMAWSNGCLCDLNPDYLRNKPQNWNHGFAIIYVWPSGNFQTTIIHINNGRCIVHGKEYKA